MWRSTSASRLLLRAIAGSRTWVKHPIHTHGAPRPSPDLGGAGVRDAEGVEPISLSEAKRLANVESLKRNLEKDGQEVIGYSEFLKVCEGAGVARTQEEAAAFARIHKGGKFLDPMPREGQLIKKQIGDNISRRDKIKFLLDLFHGLKDSKEAVYGALDAWVAWERDFPLAALRRALIMLEKDEQWHRIIQVIKWMLSKGQGNTMGTYEQLIRALEKDYRAEEAHDIWIQKIGYDLHSAPWQVCQLMISIYYRNNMLERLVKLFKGLEAFNRKPPNKSIVHKVADAYEMLGLLEEKNRVMKKYAYLFEDSREKLAKKSPRASRKNHKSGPSKSGNLESPQNGPSASVNAISSVETISF